MILSFFRPIWDSLVFGVNESDTRRRLKLLFLLLIYGHCYIVIYRSALAGQVYSGGTNTSPSFWYSVLGAMGAGAVFHLIDEGCRRLTRHDDGPSEHHQKTTHADLEHNASNPAPSPLAAIGHDSHQPLPQQPTPSLHNTTIRENPAHDPALLTPPPSKPNSSIEMFTSFRISLDDPCHKILPHALRKYQINKDWRHYDLYILFGDQERCLEPEDMPLRIFKQLDREGKSPTFMLRRNVSYSPPATTAGQEESLRQEPGAAVAPAAESRLMGGSGKEEKETETSSLFKVD
ncbi:MAG: hypothetical protein Q9207_006594 [Kuettlingeria erythrocarpa]